MSAIVALAESAWSTIYIAPNVYKPTMQCKEEREIYRETENIEWILNGHRRTLNYLHDPGRLMIMEWPLGGCHVAVGPAMTWWTSSYGIVLLGMRMWI